MEADGPAAAAAAAVAGGQGCAAACTGPCDFAPKGWAEGDEGMAKAAGGSMQSEVMPRVSELAAMACGGEGGPSDRFTQSPHTFHTLLSGPPSSNPTLPPWC